MQEIENKLSCPLKIAARDANWFREQIYRNFIHENPLTMCGHVGHSHNLLHCRKLLLSRRVEFIRDLHCEVLLANRHMQHTPKRSPTETLHKANLLIVVDQRLAVQNVVRV